MLAAAAVPLWRFLTPRRPPGRRVVRVARADIPPEGALVFREARVALVRRGEGLLALDLSCTHLGCTVNVTPREMVCPCHGSVFGLDGEVLRGPAPRRLARLTIHEESGNVEVLA